MSQFTQEHLKTLLGKYDLDYNVALTECINPFTMEKDDKNHCVYREDTKQIFAYGMSKSFTPIQNQDAFSCIVDLAKVKDIEVVKMGANRNAGVYAQINLGGDIHVGNKGDKVSRYISLSNSHDGSKALSIILSPYRLFCANQLPKILHYANEETQSGRTKLISIRHTASAKIRMEELVETLQIINGQFEVTGEHYNKMANMKINEAYVQEAITQLFPLNHDGGLRTKTIWKNTVNKIKERYYNADGGRIDVHTAWGLANAIQGVVQHDSKNTADKDWSILFGSIATRSAKVFEVVNNICSSQHVPKSIMNEIDMLTA